MVDEPHGVFIQHLAPVLVDPGAVAALVVVPLADVVVLAEVGRHRCRLAVGISFRQCRRRLVFFLRFGRRLFFAQIALELGDVAVGVFQRQRQRQWQRQRQGQGQRRRFFFVEVGILRQRLFLAYFFTNIFADLFTKVFS